MHVAEVEKHLFVIFGATGDLTARKLLPSLYEMISQQGMGERCRILGVATSQITEEQFRSRARAALAGAGPKNGDVAAWCERAVHYQCIQSGYEALAQRIAALEAEHQMPGNRVFYLALPPSAFPVAIEGLGEANLGRSAGWTRLVIEKPFGRDLPSAVRLNSLLHRHFHEGQVYRIDHYLGKETVHNLLVFRFANALFESSWNRERVKNVQITVAEDLGLEDRAGYYEQAGAVRDMMQSHLTQVFTLIAMEPPASFAADAIRDEKVKVLRSITHIDPREVVFGRYTAGRVGGVEVPGYLDEEGVADDSTTETLVALRLNVDNWRWKHVPFHLRTGKRMTRRLTEIAVTFHEPPVCLFGEGCTVHSNVLVIALQPDEGFQLFIDVKAPEDEMKLETIPLDFRYRERYGPLPEAYTTLLYDILTGDQTLFVRADEVEESWRLYTPLLETRPEIQPYEAGTWGPELADRLPGRSGDFWIVR